MEMTYQHLLFVYFINIKTIGMDGIFAGSSLIILLILIPYMMMVSSLHKHILKHNQVCLYQVVSACAIFGTDANAVVNLSQTNEKNISQTDYKTNPLKHDKSNKKWISVPSAFFHCRCSVALSEHT